MIVIYISYINILSYIYIYIDKFIQLLIYDIDRLYVYTWFSKKILSHQLGTERIYQFIEIRKWNKFIEY